MKCPTCNGTGQVTPKINTLEALREAMQAPGDDHKPVHLYEGGANNGKSYSGTFRITYKGGQVAPAVVKAALEANMLVPAYGDDTHCWKLRGR